MSHRKARVLYPGAVLFALCGATACSSTPSTANDSCLQSTSELKACPRGIVVQGIDVSVYQGTIQWAQVKAAGIDFGVARISDGATTRDSQFARNWKAMKAAGVLRGSYQYFRASENAIEQADLVVSTLNAAGGMGAEDLPVVMDVETADKQSNALVQAQMTVWLDAVAQGTGRPPVIYTNSATSSIIGPGFGRYPLWVANWVASCPTMPNGWSTWVFWQYASAGSVPGIAGMVDLDEFNGPLGDLLTLVIGDRADAGIADGNWFDAGASGGADGDGGANGSPKDADPALNKGFVKPADAGMAMGGRPAVGASGLQPCAP